MQHGALETEVKIAIDGRRADVEAKIRAAGFHRSADRVFEANVLYDDSARTLRSRGFVLRLRQAGARAIITFKGAGEPGPYKTREEIETSVDSFHQMQTILSRLGFAPVFRYEKYRTEYQSMASDIAVLTVDETPIGDFLELEGPGDWIDQSAALLGFTASDYILDSYGRLYLAHCERLGVQPGNMVFSS